MFAFDMRPYNNQNNEPSMPHVNNCENTNLQEYNQGGMPSEQTFMQPSESQPNYEAMYKPTTDAVAHTPQRLKTTHALHALSNDESSTYKSLLSRDENAEVHVMPTHRIDDKGNLRGFRLVIDAQSDCAQLPVTREMFSGSTCVECDPHDRDIHPDVIRLLSNPAHVKLKVLEVLRTIAVDHADMTVGLEHMPVYGTSEIVEVNTDDNCTGKERNEILLQNLIAERIGHHSTIMRGRDSRDWKCDIPTSLGIYHAYVRSRDSGRRHHKLFIIVSGGCRRASEQFYNMNLDLLGNATASELESCEEAWWLRRTCTRSRCRTVQMVASALDLQVPTACDVFDFHDGVSIPIHTTDTLHHDISETDDGRIALFNECCDTTSITNGILCDQHPTEGVWIFQGSQQSAVGTLSNFGGVFGHQETCGAFPTGTFSLYEDTYLQQNYASTTANMNANSTEPVLAGELNNQKSNGGMSAGHILHDTRLNLYKEKACSHVIYFNAITGEEDTEINYETCAHFIKMDEAFIKHLESHDWNREYQIIQLIPIINAVEAVSKWLKAQ